MPERPIPTGLGGKPLPQAGEWKEVEAGNMQVRIGHDRDGVFIDFGKNVSAFKLNPDMALAFAAKIHEQAVAAKIGV